MESSIDRTKLNRNDPPFARLNTKTNPFLEMFATKIIIAAIIALRDVYIWGQIPRRVVHYRWCGAVGPRRLDGTSSNWSFIVELRPSLLGTARARVKHYDYAHDNYYDHERLRPGLDELAERSV